MNQIQSYYAGVRVNKLSRTEQIIAEKTVCVLLVRGESPEGNKIYAYLAIRADKLEAFMEAQKKGTFFQKITVLLLKRVKVSLLMM